MPIIEQLKQTVKKLSRADLATFREWFREYDADVWDRQIEEDVRAGKHERLADEAQAAHKAGQTKKL